MFTGIVQACAPITGIEINPGGSRLAIDFPETLLPGLEIGASVAVEGVCLTVTGQQDRQVAFDVVAGTLARTTLGDRVVGDRVNIERSLTLGSEIGGHHVSGHISDTGTITALNRDAAWVVLGFSVPEAWRKYIFPRGFIALNGASLTVAEADQEAGLYQINLIPETLRRTSFAHYKTGHRLNFEIDSQTQIMVDTIERCFRQYAVKALTG